MKQSQHEINRLPIHGVLLNAFSSLFLLRNVQNPRPMHQLGKDYPGWGVAGTKFIKPRTKNKSHLCIHLGNLWKVEALIRRLGDVPESKSNLSDLSSRALNNVILDSSEKRKPDEMTKIHRKKRAIALWNLVNKEYERFKLKIQHPNSLRSWIWLQIWNQQYCFHWYCL